MPVFSPVYTDLPHDLPLLQQTQVFLPYPRTATLAEAIAVLTQMQREYGASTTLESLIQRGVGLHLQAQRQAMRERRRLQAERAEEEAEAARQVTELTEAVQ